MSAVDFDKKRREQRLQTCKHFNGIQHKACRAKVEYSAVEAEAPPLTGRHLPCLPNYKTGKCEGVCAKREFPTEAEVSEREAVVLRSLDRTRAAIVAITEKIGPWKRGMGGCQGELPCPVCKTGTLGYSRASINGHLWGACSTANCVRWMQ